MLLHMAGAALTNHRQPACCSADAAPNPACGCCVLLLQGLMCDWPLMRWSKEQLLQQVGDTLFKVSKPTGEAPGRRARGPPLPGPALCPCWHVSGALKSTPRQTVHASCRATSTLPSLADVLLPLLALPHHTAPLVSHGHLLQGTLWPSCLPLHSARLSACITHHGINPHPDTCTRNPDPPLAPPLPRRRPHAHVAALLLRLPGPPGG